MVVEFSSCDLGGFVTIRWDQIDERLLWSCCMYLALTKFVENENAL
jgi:hypothetical protein